jgi:hypothetical protein
MSANVEFAEAQTITDRLLMLMEERNYPGSVKQTVTGAIKWADDPAKMAREIEPLVMAAKTPREVVKAIQPLLK